MKWLIFIFLLMISPLRAATFVDAEAAFNDGRFADAISLADDLGTADSEALVARSELVIAAYLAPENEKIAHLQRAELSARHALMRDPDNIEAMLHLVIVLGYKARQVSSLAAHSAGYGREAKTLIADAKSIAPENPWVHAIEGGWNGELISAGGGFLAKLFYGASRRQMETAFAHAIGLAPDNPAIRVEEAKVLLRLDRKRYREKVRKTLSAAATMPAANAFEALLKRQGEQLLIAMGKDDQSLETVLADVTPFIDQR